MNRQQEYWQLIHALDQTPPSLDGTAQRARARAKRRRTGRRWGLSLGSLAGVCAAFVLAVNTLPTFALACGGVPILRELAAAVAFSPSLSAAVEHDYVQYVGQSQRWDGVGLALEYVIADEQQMVVFYQVDGPAPYYSVECDLKDGDGTPLTGYTVVSGESGQDLAQFEIHFTDGTPLPEELTLELRLCATDEAGNERWLEHVYPFSLRLDPARTAPAVELAVEQWVELDGQRLWVDRLELTPTKTALCLEGDPDNSAWLQNLSFHFTDGAGQVYDDRDSSITAFGQAEQEGYYTYYFQSLYFVADPSALTLWLDGAVWLDKEAGRVTVDLTDGTYTGTLPQGVTDLTVEEVSVKDVGLERTIVVSTYLSRQPFSYRYYDPEGGEHSFGGFSLRMGETDEQGAEQPHQYSYRLEGYPRTWDRVELEVNYTSVTALEQPLAVPLD